jgi:hypothetical protein
MNIGAIMATNNMDSRPKRKFESVVVYLANDNIAFVRPMSL